MFHLFRHALSKNYGKKEAPGYEWAEYNLPAAADMDVLREQNERRATEYCEASA